MELNWIFFLPALLLLFYPLNNRGTSRLRLCAYEDIRYNRGGAADGCWNQLWLWVDPLRAFAGAWLLRHAWVIDEPLSGAWNHVPLGVTMIVLALAMAARMHMHRDTTAFMAPIGFAAGITFAVLPPQVAVLVIALAGACLMAFRGWWAFFFCGAAAAGVFGYMILRVNLWMAGSVALLLEPIVLGLLFNRRLVFPVVPRRRRIVRRRTASGVKAEEPLLEATVAGH